MKLLCVLSTFYILYNLIIGTYIMILAGDDDPIKELGVIGGIIMYIMFAPSFLIKKFVKWYRK